MRYAVTAALALMLSPAASAQTMYKCQDSGKTMYSDKPCFTGVEVKRMTPSGGVTPEEIAKSRMRADAERQREMDQQRTRASARVSPVVTAVVKPPAPPGK